MNQKKFSVLKIRVAYGIFVLMIRDFGLKIISIIGQVILIRLILPEYFGIFAIITFIVGIAELFTDLGFTQSIIRERKRLTSIQISTILYIKLILSIGIILLLIPSYSLISSFYRQLTYDNFIMLIVLSSTILAKAIKGISIALIDKELNFKLIAKVDFIGVVAYFSVAIILALCKIMLWNFILALFIKEYLELFIVLYYKPLKLSLKFSIKSISHLIRYGSFLQLGNFVNFIDSSIVPIAGIRLNATQLGLLNWSFNVTSLSNALYDNYGRAAFAGMSKIQTMKNKLSAFVNRSISLLNIVSFLIIGLVIGYSREITTLFFTTKWLPALPSLYWFISSLIFYGGAVTLAHALLAIGKSKEVTISGALIVFFEILFAFFSQHYLGFSGIAASVFLAYFMLFAVYLVLAKRFGLTIEIKKIFFDKIILLFAVLIIVVFLNNLISYDSMKFLFLKIIGTIFVYTLLLYLTSKKELREIYNLILLLRR